MAQTETPLGNDVSSSGDHWSTHGKVGTRILMSVMPAGILGYF